MKSIISLMAAAAFGVASFVVPAMAADKGTVGIAMPTKASARWIDDGNNIVKQLQAAGYQTDLQYADDDIPNQLSQIENMVTKGAKVLVVASIDGTTLSDVLQKAHDAGIKVIAYDRLIRDSGNVDYYATFDNFQVGVLQAGSIVDGLGLKDGKGPFNIELFGGSPDDNNAFFFYDGAMSVLQPYIDSGKLVVKSGQTGMDKVGTLRWDPATAQARMDNLLSANYTDAKVDAVLSPYDGLSIGIISSLMGVSGGSVANMIQTLYGRTIHQAVATSAALGVPISIAGTFGYILAGLPHQAQLPPLSIGFVSLLGLVVMAPVSSLIAPYGARLAHALPRRQLEIGFAIFLLIAGARFVVSLI